MSDRNLGLSLSGWTALAAGVGLALTAPAAAVTRAPAVLRSPAAHSHGAAAALRHAPARSPLHRPVRTLDFNRDVQPILGDGCFSCHGPDPGARQAGLRLDTPEGALKKTADGVFPIVPGHPERSEVYRRITSSGPDRMPPPDSGKHLQPADIAALRQWILQGGHYKPHWAYIKPVSPPVPSVKNAAWCLNPIDHFVLARLEARGMRPSPTAGRRTLLRRLSLDLVGLPPTMEQVDDFVRDRRPDAYEKAVDRLLASPHFGERMAVRWLDLVRYADTDGYHGDQFRTVFPYRDYVINAFNHDKPFDQFTIEQIAGDLLPNATLEQKVASGYNRLNMITREGGAQPKEYLAKYAADRVRTTSVTWLGSTIGCAECHDHKFDPFTSKDFYSFESFFADLKQEGVYQNEGPAAPDMAVPTAAQASALQQLTAREKRWSDVLATSTPALQTAQAAWEQSQHASAVSWTPLHPASAVSAGGAVLTVQPDESILASGNHPNTDTYTVTAVTPLKGITAFRVEALPDPSLPMKGPGRADNGNFVLTGLTVSARPGGALPAGAASPKTAPDQMVTLQNATATWEQTSGADGLPGHVWSAALVLDPKKGDRTHGWAILDKVGVPSAAVFETAANVGSGGATTLTFTLHFDFPAHQIGRLRLSAAVSPRPVQALPGGVPAAVEAALVVDPAHRSVDQANTIAAYYRTIAPALQPARTALASVEKSRDALLAQIPRMLVAESVKPAVTRILPRGNWMDDSGAIVTPATPQFLEPLPAGEPANRLALARWIVSPDNPLTARVLVNRLWGTLFGAGIVRTTDDFGTQGAPPTNQPLLDWLAVSLVKNGWHIKPIIKAIVMSNTYKQSSHATPALLQKDPYNALMARQGRFRLDAELVRDNALAISGILALEVGGPSVDPYQPDHYWDNCNTFLGKLVYHQDHGDNLYRRGLYTIWKRSFLNPSLLAFDAPSREECTADRTVSNTPLQALVLLDDTTYVESARVFAERIMQDGGPTTQSRIDWAYRRAVCRHATPAEIAVLSGLQRQHLAGFTADPATARQLISTGESPLPKNVNPAELASWTSVARTILNLSETITRE